MRHIRSILIGTVTAALLATAATAADFLGSNTGGYDPVYHFEGFYFGGTVGGARLPDSGVVGSVGVVVGANFTITDAIVSGAEFQGDLLLDGGLAGFNTLLLGKLGGYLSDDIMVYGTAGGGLVDGAASYAFGGGLEMAVAQQLSIRGEAVGTGTWGGGPDGAKATLGVLWYMN
jgi:outer membrane immunogenic protein